MKRALPLLAAGLLVLGCLPSFESESAGSSELNAQKQTVADLRNVGTAMFSWLTDEMSAGAAGQDQQVAIADFPAISRQDLTELLVPEYTQEVPEKDGWGHPYEYYLDVKDLVGQKVIAIRSPGRDGKFSSSPYAIGHFEPSDYDQDIVWADGFFVRWPQKPPESSPPR